MIIPIEDHINVFYFKGIKLTNECYEIIFSGYSKDLNRSSLEEIFTTITNKYKNNIDESEFKLLDYNIRNLLHHTFIYNTDVNFIDIDLFTISKKEYDEYFK